MSADGGPGDSSRRGAGGRVWLVLAVAVAVVGVTLLWVTQSDQAGYATDVPPGPMTEAQVAAQCLDSLRQLDGDTLGEPVQRLVARNGDSQVRVYGAHDSDIFLIWAPGASVR